jgi:hypothetical protein
LDKATQGNQVVEGSLVEGHSPFVADMGVADAEVGNKRVVVAHMLLKVQVLLVSGTNYAHNGNNVCFFQRLWRLDQLRNASNNWGN